MANYWNSVNKSLKGYINSFNFNYKDLNNLSLEYISIVLIIKHFKQTDKAEK